VPILLGFCFLKGRALTILIWMDAMRSK
jgi:hypothetical protein